MALESDVDHEQQFQYTPLRGNDGIRLLTVSKNADGSVEVNLRLATLDPVPDYYALSYTWGDVADKVPISVNGRPYLITRSLHEFLVQTEIFKSLWIDALCINQEDLPEKGRQLARMGDIYRNAYRVIAWIGPGSEDSDICMDTIERFGELWLKHQKDIGKVEKEVLQTVMLLGLDGSLEHLACFEALHNLSKRNYWERLWIAQELSLPDAKNVLINCGSRSVRFDQLVILCNCLCSMMLPGIKNYKHGLERYLVKLLDITEFDMLSAWAGALPLLDVLDHMKARKATEPKDRLYAGLSLAKDNLHEQLAPLYPKSMLEICTTFASLKMVQDGNLDLLGYSEKSPNVFGFPSWLPDWRSPAISYPLYKRCWKDPSSVQLYNSAKGAPCNVVVASGQVLQVNGFVLDSIASVSGCISRAIIDFNELFLVVNNSIEQLGLYTTEAYVGGQETKADALARTLVMDAYIKQQGVVARNFALKLPLTAEIASDTGTLLTIGTVFPGRRLGTTYKGYMGFFPSSAEPGDIVCVLFGGQMAYVLREYSSDKYTLQGEAYVQGVMDGEAMSGLAQGIYQKRMFAIY